MQSRRVFPFILFALLLVTVAAVWLLFIRPTTQAAFGPEVVLCPGPDYYGYRCESGGGFAYIDATIDTLLYEDDRITRLVLPFPFTFYGTTYTEVWASSNGTLQFGNGNPAYANQCLAEGPVPEMGDMIAPYWDDLDLQFVGYLEYETVGEAPDRIFVIEWDDIPRQGLDFEEQVTFEVQLFEGSHDIAFLYEDVTVGEGNNGRSATIGLQSAAQGIALQYGCNQLVLADTAAIYFPHPETANDEVGLETTTQTKEDFPAPAAKADVAELMAVLNRQGRGGLAPLRTHWLSQSPARVSEWRWLDLVGNSRSQLFLLWRGAQQHPELAQAVVLDTDGRGQTSLLFDHHFSTRQESFALVEIVETADLTHDTLPDILLQDRASGQLFLITATRGQPEAIAIPQRCRGSVAALDTDQDGMLEIVRDGCGQEGRVTYQWNGRHFTPRQ